MDKLTSKKLRSLNLFSMCQYKIEKNDVNKDFEKYVIPLRILKDVKFSNKI